MANKDLELALRIKADLAEGQRQVEQFGETVKSAGDKAEAGFSKANESAEEQAARIRAMVAASLEHQEAMTKEAAAAERSGAAAQAASSNWQAVVTAQNAAAAAAVRHSQAQESTNNSTRKTKESVKDEARELSELLGRIDPVIRKLDELDDMEQRLRASRNSGALDADTFDVFNSKLQAQRTALTGSNQAMKAAALTAGQYQQAMRQLPMQITDITTSLVSGMPIWMVAVQQGGQIKDSFGGIGNAGRAVLSIITPMKLALAAVAGAIIATGVAYYQGSRESEAYNEALIMTGNIAGTTADSMNDMAARLDGISGTQRQAAAALTEIANEGKFTAAQLEQIGTTAVLMENTVGRAVSATVAEFRSLAEDPVKGITSLNEKYHFLTLAVFQQIAALQEQGRVTEAAQLAFDTYATVQNQRMGEIQANQGLLERSWKAIAETAAEAWDAMLGIGRETPLADLEKELAAIDAARSGGRRSRSNAQDNRAVELRAEIARRKEAQAQAEVAAKQQRINDAAITAEREIQKLRDQTLSKAEQREKEIAKYRRNVEAVNKAEPNSITEEQQDKDIAAINAKYADRKVQGEENKRASAYAALNRQIAERIAVLDAANDAEQKLTESQRFSEKVLESLENGTYKFTAAQKEAVRAQLATLAAADQVNQAQADSKALDGINQRLLAAQGQQVASAAVQLEKQYGDLLKRLEARGDTAGAAMVRKLIDVETARARMAELQAEIESAFADQARKENSLRTQVEAGVVSEVEARRQIVDLHAETADQIERLLPEMERLAEVTGDPQMVENLAKMREEANLLKETASELQIAFKDAFESGLSNSIQELAKGTQNLKEAALSFAGTIGEAMLRLASDQIANQAFTGLTSMFDGVQAGAAQAQTAMQAVQATKLSTDATMLASTETTLATQTATSTAAAAETTAAWTPAATATSIGSWGTAAAIGLAAVVAALAFKGFAEGGQVRGPGTGTSDSIPAWLSHEEFITRAAVVTQPGALPFLKDFNRRGMVALNDWSGAVRHSTGGLAGIPAPEMPSSLLQSADMAMPSAGGDTTIKNNMDLHVYDDPNRIADGAFNTRQGREAFYVMLSRDPGKIRSILKI